jgi:hypothetical protein
MRILAALFIAVACFSAGAFSGWDSGMQDAQNMYSCTTDK